MSIYCIADIHGCYDEFIELLELIRFDARQDTLYVLGDAVDRGEKPIDCLRFIMRSRSMYYITGNHDQMMLDYYGGLDEGRWLRNGCLSTVAQIETLTTSERDKLFSYVRSRPLYKTVGAGNKRYFLSHAGLDASLPFVRQNALALTWSRKDFIEARALKNHICIFGHTPVWHIHPDSEDCSVWEDSIHRDKICIDCGCVYGGALAALRLDDGETFYVKSRSTERALFIKSDLRIAELCVQR